MITASPWISKRVKMLESLSTCKRAHVACVFTDAQEMIIGGGYNNNPNDFTCDRPEVQGGCGCLHAEVVAAVRYRHDATLDTAWVSRAPCGHCAKVLIACGVRHVNWFAESWPMAEGIRELVAGCVTYQMVKYADD
jgi:deoxycytidylate deaminase